MFKKPHWFHQWTNSKPKNPLSLEHLRYLCNVMSKNSAVTEQNKTLLVETLRQVAEILIWGDQNDSTVFDFFLERNMLSFFLDIMKQKCGNYVTVQLLQTLNILFENIRHETSLYYLLSNNHVNSIILHKFDLTDEEVMAYYISFLKTLSFKLNPHTIHFFFNTSDFPLYTEAIKYFNHPEKMVRIAVRILTLNVFKVDEKSMLKFITGQAVPCLTDLVHFIRDNVTNIEKCIRDSSNPNSPSTPPPSLSLTAYNHDTSFSDNQSTSKNNSSPSALNAKVSPQTGRPLTSTSSPKFKTADSDKTTPTTSVDNVSPVTKTPNLANSKRSGISGSVSPHQMHAFNNLQANLLGSKALLRLDDLFAEHLDHLHYLNDVLMLKIDGINRILSDNLMHHLVKPLVDAYKDDPHNSMVRLFTLEFATSILTKVLATSLYEDSPEDEAEEDLNNVSGETSGRLGQDVKDCDDKQDLTIDKLTSAQLAIIEQSKEIAEIKVKALLKTDSKQGMTYLSLFDSEYNDMRKKRLSIDYLLMDIRMNSSPSFLQAPPATLCLSSKQRSTTPRDETDRHSAKITNTEFNNQLELERARYQIRDFLLWRQLLLNIRNEKDRELSLKNTSWLSYAKLLQWLE